MSPARAVEGVPALLYRIGRLPDPLAWPSWEFVAAGRYDDPQRSFRTLYLAEQRRGCFVELLAPFRPSLAALALVRRVAGSDEPLPSPKVPPDWYRKRAVGRLRLADGQRFLDLRQLETRESLRAQLAEMAGRLGLSDFDLSGALGPWRDLTQHVARWAYEQGYGGIAYHSRLDAELDCWALFEGTDFEKIGEPEPILASDPDLREAAGVFGLTL